MGLVSFGRGKQVYTETVEKFVSAALKSLALAREGNILGGCMSSAIQQYLSPIQTLPPTINAIGVNYS